MPVFKMKDTVKDYFMSGKTLESEHVFFHMYKPDIGSIVAKFQPNDWQMILPNVDEKTFNAWNHYIDRIILVAFDKSTNTPFGFVCIEESHHEPMKVSFDGGTWKHSIQHTLLAYEATNLLLEFLLMLKMDVYVTCLITNNRSSRFLESLGFQEYEKDKKLSYKKLDLRIFRNNIVNSRKRQKNIETLKNSTTFHMSLGSKEL